MGLIDLGKTLRASTRPLDIIYVIDTSWSMGGRKIEAVNRAMHELERLLCDEAKKNPLADVKVRILAFNNEKAYWHLKERTSAQSFKYEDIVSVEGGTPFGSALDKIAEALSDNDSIRGLPPIIVVMSDGWPTDAWEVSLERLLSTPWGKKATKIDIRNAVEKLFGVKVVSVATINVKGKPKRQGVHAGKTSDWKKAIVTIDTNPSDMTYLEKGGKEKTISGKKYKTSIEEFGA